MSFETTETTTVVSCLPGPSQPPVIKHGDRKSSVNQLEKRLNFPAKFDSYTGIFSNVSFFLWQKHHKSSMIGVTTIWLFNIALENPL